MSLLWELTAMCLAITSLILGLILLYLMRRLERTDERPLTVKSHGLGIVTDVGQFKPDADRGRVDGLTNDDIEWARELGATTTEEILDLVRKHEESER